MVRPAAAVNPNKSVSPAMRRSVRAPATGSVTLAPIVSAWQPAQHFTNACVKAQSAEYHHEPWPRVQPAVKKVSDRAADHNRAHKGERQLQGKRRLGRKVLRLFWRCS